MNSTLGLVEGTTAASQSAAASGSTIVNAFSIGIFALIFLQRFAVNIAGYPIQLVLGVVVAVLGYLMWHRAARVDAVRLIGFLILSCVLAVEGLLLRGASSVTSLGLLLVIYALCTVVVNMPREIYVEILRRFQLMMLIAAVLGVVQFFSQFALPAKYLFSFDSFLPAQMLLPRFNTVIPVQHGGSIFKSNGFFFIEPSTFSQYLALAIIVELAVFRSGRRAAVFGFSYLFTYSGTGLLVMAAAVPMFLGSLRARHLLAGSAILVVAVMLSDTLLDFDVFLDRASSFDNEHSSAYARFVGPWHWIRDMQGSDSWRMFFGFGAGTVETLSKHSHVDFHDPTWAKVLIEYGLVGAVSFFAFYLYCVFSRMHEWRINWALLVMFAVTGGALLNPFMACAVLLLGILPARMPQGPHVRCIGAQLQAAKC